MMPTIRMGSNSAIWVLLWRDGHPPLDAAQRERRTLTRSCGAIARRPFRRLPPLSVAATASGRMGDATGDEMLTEAMPAYAARRGHRERRTLA